MGQEARLVTEESPDGHWMAAGWSPWRIDSQYDWGATTPSTAVVETVAVAIDEPALDMPPLHAQIDPGALDTLVTGEFSGSDRASTTITFEYADTHVKVTGRGRVVVESETVRT